MVRLCCTYHYGLAPFYVVLSCFIYFVKYALENKIIFKYLRFQSPVTEDYKDSKFLTLQKFFIRCELITLYQILYQVPECSSKPLLKFLSLNKKQRGQVAETLGAWGPRPIGLQPIVKVFLVLVMKQTPTAAPCWCAK